MQQDITEYECGKDGSGPNTKSEKSRALTYDELKAAEAAFRGEPFNPAWSAAAAQVYAGIVGALAGREQPTPSQIDPEGEYIRC
ncbi:MAG TPA: hypothetical protein VJ805_01505 [Nitrospiraceae bacterium]|nr:hypothetical protein [Nitrospiraceae bacterium]